MCWDRGTLRRSDERVSGGTEDQAFSSSTAKRVFLWILGIVEATCTNVAWNAVLEVLGRHSEV